MSSLQGETDYEFTDKQSYKDYLHRLEGVPSTTTTIINNMKQGIRKRDITYDNYLRFDRSIQKFFTIRFRNFVCSEKHKKRSLSLFKNI